MRVRRVVVAETAEEQIVGPRLAELQRIVAGLGAAGADHHLVLHAVDHVGELRLAAVDMDAVGAHAAGDPRIAGNDRRDALSWASGTTRSANAWNAGSSRS